LTASQLAITLAVSCNSVLGHEVLISNPTKSKLFNVPAISANSSGSPKIEATKGIFFELTDGPIFLHHHSIPGFDKATALTTPPLIKRTHRKGLYHRRFPFSGRSVNVLVIEVKSVGSRSPIQRQGCSHGQPFPSHRSAPLAVMYSKQ